MPYCEHCKKHIQGKPWISFSPDTSSDPEIHCCGYLCHKAMVSQHPCSWEHVINKEDFNEPRPLIMASSENPMFEYLSYEELRELSEDQIDLYYDLVGSQSYLNNFRYEVIQEIEAEEKRVREIEEGYDYSSDDSYEI